MNKKNPGKKKSQGSSATRKAAPAKPALSKKPPAKKKAAAKDAPAKSAAFPKGGKDVDDGEDFEDLEDLKDIELLLPFLSAKEAPSDAPATGEEKAGLEKVMASLSQIFGGKEFLSDAELDAFLDSKMASGEIPPSMALDPLDEAQSLVYEAWNTEGPHKIELARRALDLSQDCADAFVILAQEEAKTREAALALYRKGLEAGQRALDPALFAVSAGKFWEIMETRPYMRARLGLAECLWDLGKKAEALGHLRDLIRLNPSDDQGVRYILLQCLLESGADEELGALFARYGNDTSPEIKYTHALWMFRRQGSSDAANALLREAVRANPHVPDYLLKRKKLPKRIPESALEGSEDEAEAYAHGALDPWHKTLGALEWLSSGLPGPL